MIWRAATDRYYLDYCTCPYCCRSKASWWRIGAGGGGGPALFVLKTYEMVDSPSTEAAVWWSDVLDTTFVVWCSLEFSSSSTQISPVSSMSSPHPSLTESLRTPSNLGQVCADLGLRSVHVRGIY
uniref:Uncharacterized protein n=1 Tax=Aegilops tauschii subsp. strangulata TaxID=200361 RepID=A0A452Y3N8_AEGTS